MSQTCEISSCDGISLTTCICCKQILCREHFVEHDSLLRPKLNDLNEQINTLIEQFEDLSKNIITEEIFIKLNQWKFNCYKIIDDYYEKQRNEMNLSIQNFLNKQENEISDLRLKFAKMINVQQTTKYNIDLIEQKIQSIQRQIEHIYIDINTHPLVITNQLIDINISNLSKFSIPYENIPRFPLSSDAITTNSQHLLIHQKSNLYLLDENLALILEQNWPYDRIQDMCWSEVLNCFFIITSNCIYQVDGMTLSIKYIETIEGRLWQSCTCSETSLYLSKNLWNSSIEEFNLQSLIKSIEIHQINENNDHKQRIDSLKYQNCKLALGINDKTKQELLIDVRSTITFDCIWFYRLKTDYSERKIQCCLFNSNTWIIADWGYSSLYHLINDGKLKNIFQYEHEICYIHFFQKLNHMIISTKHSINFHRL
ncbi:hypothetical protein I4U23_021529 [Adineta vaga]|nr:hypothetical protein I4U23_021529 [Adineta vaga]